MRNENVSEEEKKRILELHRTAIKNNYLHEQETWPPLDRKVNSGIPGAQTGTWKTPPLNSKPSQDMSGIINTDKGPSKFPKGQQPVAPKPAVAQAPNTSVRQIQQQLTDLGYGNLVGRIDGVMGPKTISALNKMLADIKQREGTNIAGINPKGPGSISPTGNSPLLAEK